MGLGDMMDVRGFEIEEKGKTVNLLLTSKEQKDIYSSGLVIPVQPTQITGIFRKTYRSVLTDKTFVMKTIVTLETS